MDVDIFINYIIQRNLSNLGQNSFFNIFHSFFFYIIWKWLIGLFEKEGRYTMNEGSSIPHMLTCELYSSFLTREGSSIESSHLHNQEKTKQKSDGCWDSD